ncbi:hypothetical protein J2795_001467 [Chryseobacterium bernardetii]|uniref:Uncharacterized protein n=1 Tax=Chryseobacterium bernardetii TaxID=1241978 RepID=A0ACC6IT37_9FLAO|nr:MULTISPECIES: hypothetical protein [Chryseobacterium]MDR6369990.1 hypothetical protein [Chryseobacterium vietnamense]MDR6440767.1 hypothetical protein [Chryseobacterium bernardetii]MDR6486729.1 hypothetical protein [Chryseobacterium vietnamense]
MNVIVRLNAFTIDGHIRNTETSGERAYPSLNSLLSIAKRRRGD